MKPKHQECSYEIHATEVSLARLRFLRGGLMGPDTIKHTQALDLREVASIHFRVGFGRFGGTVI